MEVPVDELMRQCRIEQEDLTQVGMLWEALSRFTPEERMLFIKFATGKMGLPPPSSKWGHIMTIRFDFFLPRERNDSSLPVSSTCSSTVVFPLYSSADILETRLRTAILYGCDIERDRDIAAHELVSLA
jgi:E3 ubiquitin-protein ligase HECTD3